MTARRLRALLVIVLLVPALLWLAGGWYFSDQIRSSALQVRPVQAPRYDLRVVEASGTTVTLEPTGRRPGALDEAATYGLDWGTGYGQVTTVIERGRQVTRSLRVLTGAPPVAGRPARLLASAFPDDPAVAVGRTASQVRYRSGDRELPATLVPGTGRTWAVLVHGRGATRAELHRLLRTTSALGMPSLVITYRRDPDNGGGLARFGQDEWRDVDAAVRLAVGRGAERVVLLGASMGGGMVASFLERSDAADRVAAVVLDAPMLDLGATIRHGAAQRELPVVGLPLPGALTWTARQIAAQRFDLDGDVVDYLDDTSWLTVPALVFHGTEDATVPDSVTRRLAAAEPALVQHVAVREAGHVESWNLDPAAYDDAVRRFLTPFA